MTWVNLIDACAPTLCCQLFMKFIHACLFESSCDVHVRFQSASCHHSKLVKIVWAHDGRQHLGQRPDELLMTQWWMDPEQKWCTVIMMGRRRGIYAFLHLFSTWQMQKLTQRIVREIDNEIANAPLGCSSPPTWFVIHPSRGRICRLECLVLSLIRLLAHGSCHVLCLSKFNSNGTELQFWVKPCLTFPVTHTGWQLQCVLLVTGVLQVNCAVSSHSDEWPQEQIMIGRILKAIMIGFNLLRVTRECCPRS